MLTKDEQKDNKKLWKPSKEESKLLQSLDEEMNIAIKFRSNYEDQWKDNIERYNAKPFYYEDGRAGVVLPIVKLIIESKQATEMKSPPTWSYEPLEYPEDKNIAKILDDVIKKHVWNQKYVNLDYKLDVLNQDKDILGLMYQYVGWRKIYRTIKVNKKEEEDVEGMQHEGEEKDYEMEGKEMPEKEKETEGKDKKTSDYTEDEVLYYDDICVDNISPYDVWLHPLTMCVADSPWIKIRKRFDCATFKETYSDDEFFKNVDLVKEGMWNFGGVDPASQYKEYNADDKDQVVVFEHWNKMKDQLVIVANGVIIYDGANPFEHKELPFVDYIDRLQYNTYIGEGEPQRIATIADAINAFINIAIDKEKKSASGINLLDDNLSDFDDVATTFGSNQITRVQDPSRAFVHYEIPGMSGSTSNVINMLMDYLIFATGVDFRQITDLNASTQATVAAIRREISQGRLSLNVKRNENRGFKRLGWLLMKTVQQYYPIPLVEKLSGNASKGNMPLEYRKIRIKGKNITEKPVEGKYTSESLRMKGANQNDYGFFEARPAYIRTKGDLEVRVVSESSFSASNELKKSNAKDFLQVTAATVKVDPTTGQPTPIGSLDYGYEQYVDAMGYDKDKALGSDKPENNPAKDEMQKMMGGAAGAEQGGEPPAEMTAPPPPEPPPAKLTGSQSEPVQQLRAQLGAANNVTK